MASITLRGISESIDNNGYASIVDPAVGAGVTLIAAANKAGDLLREKLNWQNHILFIGQDVSPVASQMAYIQLSLLGCAGYIKVGNTLTEPLCPGDSLHNHWFMPMYFSNTWQIRRTFHPSEVLINPYRE